MPKKTLIQEVGEALYGPRWQSDLARDLDVTDRTMRRWVADGGVPPGAYLDCLRLLVERAAEIDHLVEHVRRAATPN